MDWLSRYVLSWSTSITVEVDFCIQALERALCIAAPEIFNSDHRSQFTSVTFIKRLEEKREVSRSAWMREESVRTMSLTRDCGAQ